MPAGEEGVVGVASEVEAAGEEVAGAEVEAGGEFFDLGEVGVGGELGGGGEVVGGVGVKFGFEFGAGFFAVFGDFGCLGFDGLFVLFFGFELFGGGQGVFVPELDGAEFFIGEGAGAAEDGGEGVVVGGGDGIEFVIVAAGAAEGHAEEGFAEGVELFVDDVELLFLAVGFGEDFGAEGEEAGGGEGVFAGGLFVGGEEVAGELLDEELVVGFVVVEGADDVVAVAPGVAVGDVFVHAVGVGVAGDVEPVAGPARAVLGRGEEAVDEVAEGVGGVVGEEGGDFGGGGWEAGEVEGGAADEGVAVGGRGGGEVVFFEFGEDEGVDGGAGPGGVLDGGQCGIGEGLEGPELAALFEGEAGLFGVGGLSGGWAGIGGAVLDPGFEVADLGGGEGAFWGHLEVAIVVADGFDEAAAVGVAGDDGGAGVTAAEEGVAVIEGEAAFEFGGGGVAVEAFFNEEGADAGFEEGDVVGGQGPGGGGEGEQGEDEAAHGEGTLRGGWGFRGEGRFG